MLMDVAKFGVQCNFLPEAIGALTEAAERMEKQPGAAEIFESCRRQLFAGTGDYWKTMTELAEQAGVHPYTAHQLLIIFCTGETKARYEAAGYSGQFYWDAMKDVKHKMEETHEIYGVWGVYCGWWLEKLIRLQVFCLGRLQFEMIESEFDHEIAGHTLHRHDPVVNMHIPSFGRMYYADVLDAYGRAAEFFGRFFPDGAVWFHAETWILYPQVTALLPEGNLKRYAEDFDIVRAWIDPETDDRYRVFMLPAHVPMEEYPEKNTLQRNLKAWLLDGNTMGIGFGLFLWKDGKIVPHSCKEDD